MTALFWLSDGAGVLIMWGVVEGIGWCVDAVRIWWLRRTFLRGTSRAYIDAGRIHRETQRELGRLARRPALHADTARGSGAGGLDVSESLSRHTARKSREVSGDMAARPRGVSAHDARARSGRDHRSAARGTTLQFTSATAKKSVN